MKLIEDSNLSYAWARGTEAVLASGGEVAPLVVSVTGGYVDGVPPVDPGLESALDALIAARAPSLSIHTVANTIFPESLWNESSPRSTLYDRYISLWPRIKRSNPYGTYFHRLITGGSEKQRDGNQLEFILQTYTARGGVRRSVLQAAIFDPGKDHTSAAQRGFPCLQHVSFAVSGHTLAVNAFYTFQYMVDRAYGNYLGLCRLGNFMARELGLELNRMTCFTGIAKRDARVGDIRRVLRSVPSGVLQEDVT